MTEEEFRTGVSEDGRRIISSADALEIARLIDLLRAEEGSSVTIGHDSPDFGGPNCVIICEGSWIKGLPDQEKWHPCKSFFGETVLDCLRQAHAEMEANRS